MKDSCDKKDCAYWRDTPLGDSHHKCITCCHSAWLPKPDKDNYKPNWLDEVVAAVSVAPYYRDDAVVIFNADCLKEEKGER